ncbi:MAG: hypothetical protein PHR53_01175 [Bacteroidales bacterium]|nr:hypothetical protein [Bacteroidales bacterium]
MIVKRLLISTLSVVMLMFFMGCKSQKPTTQPKTTASNGSVSAIPPVIIYKMVKDFSNYVPVIMNKDKTEIVSYPSVKDIKVTAKPTALINDYWLDNRGISKNVAFLKYTYEEYSKMTTTPTVDVLMKNIMNKNPLLEIYNCGKKSDYKDLVKDLNLKIKEAGNEMDKFFTPIK